MWPNPLGLNGVELGQGDTYEGALLNIKSTILFSHNIS